MARLRFPEWKGPPTPYLSGFSLKPPWVGERGASRVPRPRTLVLLPQQSRRTCSWGGAHEVQSRLAVSPWSRLSGRQRLGHRSSSSSSSSSCGSGPGRQQPPWGTCGAGCGLALGGSVQSEKGVQRPQQLWRGQRQPCRRPGSIHSKTLSQPRPRDPPPLVWPGVIYHEVRGK